jgi:hypothetical protein
VVNPFAEIIRGYQRYIWLPGTVYGLILLVGLGGMVLAWRRIGGEALLPWAISLALVVIPAATAEFDYRYVLPAAPFACLAAVMAFSPGTAGGSLLRRLRAGRHEAAPVVSAPAPVVSAPVVSAPVVSAPAPSAEAGDDERDLATDGH